MHSGPCNPVIFPEASWIEVVTAISQGGLGAVNVIDQQGKLLGIITDGDLRRSIEKLKLTELGAVKAKTIMTVNPITTTPQQLAFDALQVMENRPSQISVLPVIDLDQHSVGLIRLHDIARSGLL